MNNWQTNRLGDLAKVYDGTHQTPDYVDSGVPFYSVEHVTANDFSNTKFISEDVFAKESKRVKIENDDILMTRIGDIGTARYIDWDVRASFYVSLALIKCNDLVEARYLAQVINSRTFQRELWKRSLTVAFPHKINLGDIGKSELSLPSKPEQQRIVAVLEVWDEYLELLDQKIALKEQLKKGLMQQLLAGKKRLPGFIDEWSQAVLGELYKITSSKRVFESDWKRAGIPFYRAREVIKLRNDGHVNNELFISNEMFEQYKDKYGSVKKDDILVTGVGTVGIAYKVQGFTEFYFKDGNIIWLKGQEKVSSAFIEHLFNSDIIKRQIHKFTPVTTVATYTIEMANQTKVPIPSHDEQDAISEVISIAAGDIVGLKYRRALAAAQKKYLLKNLISGTIRTPENLQTKGAN